MSNPSKQKGTAAETAVVNFLRSWGWADAERRALHGALDLGDIAGIPDTVVEIKNRKTLEITAWMRETERERQNANARFGVLTYKPRGITDPGMWPHIVPGWQMMQLLKSAVLL